eukprot:COSAG02_NODE_1389_length_12913_cov_414.638889_2_plen_70_part_00
MARRDSKTLLLAAVLWGEGAASAALRRARLCCAVLPGRLTQMSGCWIAQCPRRSAPSRQSRGASKQVAL